jgi:hypothetical protein
MNTLQDAQRHLHIGSGNDTIRKQMACKSISGHVEHQEMVCSKWVWLILRVERRCFVLSKIRINNKPSTVSPYPSDLDEIGCKNNGKTCTMVLVKVPRPETTKLI